MRLIFILLSALLLSGCATNLVYMSVQEPAPVTMPQHIKKVGIINRSYTDKADVINNVDQVLSLEFKNLDREGSDACVDGLTAELKKNTRFETVKKLPVEMKSPGAGVFPAQITWDEAGKICKNHGVDALYILEMFDTDTKVSYATHNTTVKTPLGDVPAIEHEATMVTFIHSGWRIYDIQNKVIVDEFKMTRDVSFSGRGINPVAAANALLGRKEAVKQVALKNGEEYAQSILSYWIRVNRDYYVKGSPNMKMAKRRAQTGNWDGAAELWLKDTTHPKFKTAGRAHYNMAIINEINGNLDEAIRWAQKSYEDYGNKLALNYVNILKNRKAKANELQRQNQGQ